MAHLDPRRFYAFGGAGDLPVRDENDAYLKIIRQRIIVKNAPPKA